MVEPLPVVPIEEMKDKDEKKDKNKGGNMAKAKGISDFILPIGILVLGYYTLKNWGIIGTTNPSLGTINWESWEPLSKQEIQNIRNSI